ncbi:gluconokinase [Crossiella cryophila]|uniref:Gluconokinase n=1 Tax=Crossiella cryophila TaxID=43355 RepID=A0A7W7FTW3_9PSEU|nr:gluconokinase [Crossiella cryophila]MBB4675204.1 gluconokinase [Crossiella cryophila]
MTMGDGVVLGIDLGTTATKVVAADRRGRVAALAERGYPMRTDQPGLAVHDPDRVLQAALDAVRECAQTCAAPVQALVFTGAMHTLIGLDAGYRPITPSLSWADNRAIDQAARLRRDPAATELHRATGTPVHPFAPLAKLIWFAEQDPDTQPAFWCSLKDFVLHHFTGRLATEHSYASGSGLMNIHRLAWHQPSLDLAGITADRLPELLAPTDTLPLRAQIAEATGLPPGLPVVAGGGDGPLANLGVGAVRPGMAALSLGTSGALRVVRTEPGVDERGRTFCYGIAEGYWVLGGAVSNGGVVSQWAADLVGEEDMGDLLAEAATVPPGANGLFALPYLLGERAPWWDPDPRGLLLGLRRDHGRAELTRALVEGVAQQLALVRDAVRDTGAAVNPVRATGGAFRSPLWGQLIAAALDTDLEITEDSEGSGLGACLLGWRALDVLPSLEAAAELITPSETVHPDPELAEHFATARPRVERTYLALRELMS